MKNLLSIILIFALFLIVAQGSPVLAEGWCTSATIGQVRDGACIPSKPGFRYRELCGVDGSTIYRSEITTSSCDKKQSAACTNDWRCILAPVNDPTGIQGNNGEEQISNFLSIIIRLIFVAAAVVFVFLIISGAIGWMTSGGEKEALAKARSRLTHAIIGLVILSLAFVIINIIANITNIGILKP